LWKLRLGLREQADEGYATCADIFRIIGHCNWAALVRRQLVSIFSAAYKCANRAGDNRWRLWPQVISELRAASALVCFCYLDTRRPIETTVVSTDACTGDLNPSGTGFGGYGVTERVCPADMVWDAARRSERWRYSVDMAISARQFAFDVHDGLIGAGALPPRGFASLDEEMLFPMDAWNEVLFGRWTREEDILRLEGRALLIGLRRRLRALRSRGSLMLFLCDNLSLTFAITKGRSSGHLLNQTCRELCALSICYNISVVVRWLPSEWNTSDAGSRRVTGRSCAFAADPRNVGTERAALLRGAAQERMRRDAASAAADRGVTGRVVRLGGEC